MEGKAALFKRFAGIDALPICLATQDTDEIVRTVADHRARCSAASTSRTSPRRGASRSSAGCASCLDIPVFHDDQHGTAIVVLAALTNALRVVGKELADVRIVLSGAGAAGQRDPRSAAGRRRHRRRGRRRRRHRAPRPRRASTRR